MIELDKAALIATSNATGIAPSACATVIYHYNAACPPLVVTDAMWRDAHAAYSRAMSRDEGSWEAAAAVLRHVGPQHSVSSAERDQGVSAHVAPSASAPADLAALAEAAASEHAPRDAMAKYLRAVATERRRVAALDADVVRVMKSYLDAKSRTGIMCVVRALARRYGGTP